MLSAISFVTITLLTPAPEPETIEEVTFDKRTWAEETDQLRGKPWFKNYRWISAGLLALTVAVVVPFI